MRSVYRISMFMFVLCAQVTMMMAQRQKPEIVPAVYGIYEGEATNEMVNEKTGAKTPGQKRKVTIEISEGETEFTVVALKDFTIGQYSFDKIPYESCLLYPQTQTKDKKWQIYLESNLYNTFTTKDKKHNVTLGGNIDDDKSFVHEDGTLELDFDLTFDYKTTSKYVFKGKKVKNTTGINKITGRNARHTVYDLQGRRVEKPGKGIYIVNGKKIVFK
ncbi:hypothetical protein JHU38_08700 [Prevotella sp. A2931]|uniref:Lipocalin-like domain-containing protein n=2 Tax=Prevotella illustrans TaxID=2800387 RepID=A0ABS3M6U8_9BACT|nr:hypothetical protein [Prevotella sp. oral taxon 820]MBO1363845.1 hypothetical protein [Prevotella illustrans]PTL27107.1 hypothetical protein C3V39_08810 [Prevotella sp. oral taxon 820]